MKIKDITKDIKASWKGEAVSSQTNAIAIKAGEIALGFWVGSIIGKKQMSKARDEGKTVSIYNPFAGPRELPAEMFK